MVAFFLAFCWALGATIALVNPRSQIWWGPTHRPRPRWQVSAVNKWMFDDIDTRKPSRAGVLATRSFGVFLLVAAVAMSIQGFQQLS